MKTILILCLGFVMGFSLGLFIGSKRVPGESQTPGAVEAQTPLDKYAIEALSETQLPQAKLSVGETLTENDNFSHGIFSLTFSPALDGKTKKTTGIINTPASDGKFPIVVMIRGYVDQTLYFSGAGTERAAEFFADNGFITVAPDFLGYADSDSEAADIFESRFQTYTTAVSLINSLDQIDSWDGKNVFLWGHSNGGHIALTVLEITGSTYPTTLWAPVSAPFPYSVLYYTNESDDRGKLIRHELSKFEDLYDVENYSLDNYLDRINAAILLHQGTKDDAIPIDWSNNLYTQLNKLEKDVTYYTYPGADHNLRPDWDTVVARDLEFFLSQLKDN